MQEQLDSSILKSCLLRSDSRNITSVISRMQTKKIRNKIIYLGICTFCGEDFYTYATNYPSYCSKACGKFRGGHLLSDGYFGLYYKGKHVRLHRLIYEFANGKLDSKIDIHHINGNKLDNRLDNLRAMTKNEHTREHNRISRLGN